MRTTKDWLFFLATVIALPTYAQNWQWVVGKTGTGDALSNTITTDINGNVFIGGTFSASIQFGTSSLFAGSSNSDMYVAKYNMYGIPLWAKSAGGGLNETTKGIVTDNNGNLYAIGTFQSSSISFDTIYLSNGSISPYLDIFIVKYDSNGNVVWAKKAGGYDDDEALGIVIDSSTHLWITGYFKSPNITFGSFTLNNSGDKDVFLIEMDTAGNTLMAKNGNGSNYEVANAICNSKNCIYITGYFKSPILRFDTATINGHSNESMFLVKYQNGNAIWAKAYGDTAATFSGYPSSIASSDSGFL